MRAPRYRLPNIAQLTRREAAAHQKKNAVVPHGEAPYSQYQHAVWEQLQYSNPQPTQYFPGPQFWTQSQQPNTSDPYYSQHNQNSQQQEWDQQSRLFQGHHIPDQPQLQHGWGQQASLSEPSTIHDQSYYGYAYHQEPPTSEWGPGYNASNQLYSPRFRPLTRAPSDVSMLDESTECDRGEDIMVSGSNPPTPYKRPQTLPIGDSVLFQQSAHLQGLSYLASLGLEYLGLKQLSLNSAVAPPAPVSTIAPIAVELNLPANGLQGWRQPPLVAQEVYPQPPPNSLMSPPISTNTSSAPSNDLSKGEKSIPDVAEPEPQVLTGPGHDNVPINTSGIVEPEAPPKRLDTTNLPSPHEVPNAFVYLSPIPSVIGNPTPNPAMAPPAELDHQPTDGSSSSELGPGVLTPLDKTAEIFLDFHDQFHELFSSGFDLPNSANYSDPFQWNESQSTLISADARVDNPSGRAESSVTHDHSDGGFAYDAFGEAGELGFDDLSGVQKALDEVPLQKRDGPTSQQAHDGEVPSHPGPKRVPSSGPPPEKPYLMPGKASGTQYASPNGTPPDLPDSHTWNHVTQIDTSLLMIPEMAACGSSVSGYSSLGPDTPRGDPNVDAYVVLPETSIPHVSPTYPIEDTFLVPTAFDPKIIREKRLTKDSEPELQAVTNRLAKTVNECLHESFTATNCIIEKLHSIQPFIDVKNAIEIYTTTRETLTRLCAATKLRHECYNGCQSWHISQDKLLRKIRKRINNYRELLCAPGVSPGKRIRKTRVLQAKFESSIDHLGTRNS